MQWHGGINNLFRTHNKNSVNMSIIVDKKTYNESVDKNRNLENRVDRSIKQVIKN